MEIFEFLGAFLLWGFKSLMEILWVRSVNWKLKFCIEVDESLIGLNKFDWIKINADKNYHKSWIRFYWPHTIV